MKETYKKDGDMKIQIQKNSKKEGEVIKEIAKYVEELNCTTLDGKNYKLSLIKQDGIKIIFKLLPSEEQKSKKDALHNTILKCDNPEDETISLNDWEIYKK